jgi:hypothetical protein
MNRLLKATFSGQVLKLDDPRHKAYVPPRAKKTMTKFDALGNGVVWKCYAIIFPYYHALMGSCTGPGDFHALGRVPSLFQG